MVLFEKQSASLCGMHALNHLVQSRSFQVGQLADIAAELDAQERSLGLTAPEVEAKRRAAASRFLSAHSSNVDESGNYSIQVLQVALQRAFGVNLRQDQKAVEGVLRAADEGRPLPGALVFNSDDHWSVARELFWTSRSGQKRSAIFWLNSLEKAPSVVTRGYLAVLVAQLKDEWTIYVTEGPLPDPIMDTLDPGWYDNDDIVEGIDGKSSKSTEANSTADSSSRSVTAFSGKGYSLKAARTTDTDDDEELAAAIAASLNDVENPATTTASSDVAVVDDPTPPLEVEVGVGLVLPGTGKRVRKRFPPRSTGKDVIQFAQEQIQSNVRFRLVEPTSKVVVTPNFNLTKFAPSVTLIIEEV